MAVGWLSLVVGLFLAEMFIQRGEAANQITLTSVSVENDNDTLIVSVIYSADYEPDVIWVMPTFRRGGGLINLDHKQTDTYNQGQGQTILEIQHDVARTKTSRIFNRKLLLRNLDCEVELLFPSFEDLIARSASSQTFHSLAPTLDIEGNVLDPGQDIVLTRYTTYVTAKLSSPELAKFDVNGPWIRRSRFEYGPGEFPGRKNFYGYSDGVHSVGRSWSGNSTTKELAITLNNIRTATGILTLYLSSKQRSGTDSIVTGIEFKQNYYLVQEKGEEVVWRNTVYIKNDHSHSLTEFDVPMSRIDPKFSFTVVGNPMPQVSLHRACSELSAAEVEVIETKPHSKYEITYHFRFKKAKPHSKYKIANHFRFKKVRAAITGSYNVVARSGTMEAREILFIGMM